MENEISTLSENDKLVLAFKAGSSRLEDIFSDLDSCVIIENTVPDNDPNANVFKFQHQSGRVYTLTQRVYNVKSNYYEICWVLVTCSMNGVLYNLTNLRRHNWEDWLTDDTIAEKMQYSWFRFHGKRLRARACCMEVNVYDDGKVSVEYQYESNVFVERLLANTKHLANHIQQKDLKADADYISGNHKRKQMQEVVNSVMAIEGPAECIAKAFDSNIFQLRQTVDPGYTTLFDEVDIAKVTVELAAVLPSFENRVAFSFKYKLTVNTQDMSTKCDENQAIDLTCRNPQLAVEQMYKGSPFIIKKDMTSNKDIYTNSTWRDNQMMKLGEISYANRATGKSFIQEYADNYSALLRVIDAVKSVC